MDSLGERIHSMDADLFLAFLDPVLEALPWGRTLARWRFKKQLGRGHMECWVRSNDIAKSGIWTDWERGFVSFRAPSVDFVRTAFSRPPGDPPFTFLVSGKADPGPGIGPRLVPYLGRNVSSIQLQTTRGIVEIAGFPEAMEYLEAELFPRNGR
jgi:hypothetical protein